MSRRIRVRTKRKVAKRRNTLRNVVKRSRKRRHTLRNKNTNKKTKYKRSGLKKQLGGDDNQCPCIFNAFGCTNYYQKVARKPYFSKNKVKGWYSGKNKLIWANAALTGTDDYSPTVSDKMKQLFNTVYSTTLGVWLSPDWYTKAPPVWRHAPAAPGETTVLAAVTLLVNNGSFAFDYKGIVICPACFKFVREDPGVAPGIKAALLEALGHNNVTEALGHNNVTEAVPPRPLEFYDVLPPPL